MTTDKEMLELAAKAAGIQGEYVTDYGSGNYYYNGNVDGILHEVPHTCGQMYVWNPLEDDGDALRLAVHLRLRVLTPVADRDCAIAHTIGSPGDAGYVYVYSEDGLNPYAATRRAIVRAAAEIGRNME